MWEDLVKLPSKLADSREQRQILNNLLFNDAYEVETDQKIDESGDLKRESEFIMQNFNMVLAKQLYVESVKEKNTFGNLRLGDLNFYGRFNRDNSPDYKSAIKYYENAVLTNTSRDTIAQSYNSLGYMHQFGLGTERNQTQAIIYYNKVFFLPRSTYRPST